MDSAKENQKVLLLHRPPTAEEADAWARFAKALATLGSLETRELAEISFADLSAAAPTYTHVFLDVALADFPQLGAAPLANLTFVRKDTFGWNTPRARALMGPALLAHNCFLIEDLPAADLVRTLHLYLHAKRLVGVTALLEKGSIIVGEKIQSLETVGTLMDKLGVYLEGIEGFTLAGRVFDLRQVLGNLIGEAFQRATESAQPYPTVDFQVGAARQKIVVNLRFPRGSLDLDQLPRLAFEGEDLRWQQTWALADILFVTHHLQYDEVEVMLVLNRASRSPGSGFRSFLRKRSERSAKQEALLTAPQNYEFHLLSDVRTKQQDALYETNSAEDLGVDLGSLPAPVVERLEKLEQESEYYREQTKKKDAVIREAATKIGQANKEISQKRNDLLRTVKAKEAQTSALNRKIAELEKRLEQNPSALGNFSAHKEASNAGAPNLQETVTKLETSLKAAENEKSLLVEKVAREEKKVSAYEQKYSTLYKEIGQKDKELNELKATVIKIRKEQSAAAVAAAASTASGAGTAELQAKLKEVEARETAFKQEIKKLAFKIENNDKNVKAIQTESVEKVKLLEQKLQAAKTRELELLKKIDELTAALKKAAKAA